MDTKSVAPQLEFAVMKMLAVIIAFSFFAFAAEARPSVNGCSEYLCTQSDECIPNAWRCKLCFPIKASFNA